MTRRHLVLKLPRDRVGELVERGCGLPIDAGNGTPMKEWVALPEGTAPSWLPLAKEALAFVRGARVPARRR